MKTPRWPILGSLSQKEFLSRYWQKRPLLMRGALAPFPDLITPDELAGMACQEGVESRLIVEKGGKTPWELRRGPFKPSLFKKLPPTHWTFLVNGVDRFVPAVHALLDHFSFVPFWRMDDVMISYAVEGGNVGAHVDNFDVFLVQAHGEREWLIEDRPVWEDDFVPNIPIRLLKHFRPTHRWVLKPGDILYLPPRFPHHGIARGKECMTVSVGFRAPAVTEIVQGVLGAALAGTNESHRLTDPDLKPQPPGEIAPHAVDSVLRTIKAMLENRDVAAEWLGCFSTEPYADVDFSATATPLKPTQVKKALRDATHLVRAEGARLAYIHQKEGLLLFVNGAKQQVAPEARDLACLIADHVVVPVARVMPLLEHGSSRTLLAQLISSGTVVVETRDDDGLV